MLILTWSHKKVLVTGAGGFIGSHLVERLVSLGANTRALVRYNSSGTAGWLDRSHVRSEIEILFGDIRDWKFVRHATSGVDVVFHLAALIGIPYSYHAPFSYLSTNIEGTLNILQTALDADVEKLVQTSTSEVYGTARHVPINEDHPLQAQSPYAASKIGADKLAESFHLSFGLPVTIIRPFNTFGPRQSGRAVIPTIISQALTQSTVKLGHLTSTRDFNYVADTVEGFIQIAQAPDAVGQVINIGSGEEISIQDLTQLIFSIAGKEKLIEVGLERLRPETSEVERLCADNEKAKRLLGWMPKYTLKEGLIQTISWIENNLDRYQLGQYTI